jgi:putative tricarboxylic transport membrane protein
MTRRVVASERVAGIACIVVALAIALAARTFHVAFLTDPIGPRALPWLAALLLALGGLRLALRPGIEPAWPEATMRTRIAVTLAAFVAYAALIAPLGFVLSTTLLMMVIGRVFGGRTQYTLLAGFAFSGAMWLLFVQLLGVPLPIGLLFLRG